MQEHDDMRRLQFTMLAVLFCGAAFGSEGQAPRNATDFQGRSGGDLRLHRWGPWSDSELDKAYDRIPHFFRTALRCGGFGARCDD